MFFLPFVFRLFNQSKGLDQGFGAEDDTYNVYDKPWRAANSLANNIYRPSKGTVSRNEARLSDHIFPEYFCFSFCLQWNPALTDFKELTIFFLIGGIQF